MIEVLEYSGDEDGQNILITGGIHGNETCGVLAIRQWIEELDSGKRTIKKGTVRFIACCNPKAFEQNTRYVEVNLNRVIKKHADPKLYEEKLANEIVPHMNWADIGVDLHSYTSSNEPFVFCDADGEEMLAYSKIAPVDFIVTGFDEMLDNQEVTTFCSTQGYYLKKNKLAVTIECGQHTSETSPVVAYQCIEKYLSALGFIDPVKTTDKEKRIIRVKEIFYKTKAGKLAQPWRNLHPVKKGETLIVYEDGEEVKAPFDGLVLLPAPTPIGEDWFYLAQEA